MKLLFLKEDDEEDQEVEDNPQIFYTQIEDNPHIFDTHIKFE